MLFTMDTQNIMRNNEKNGKKNAMQTHSEIKLV